MLYALIGAISLPYLMINSWILIARVEVDLLSRTLEPSISSGVSGKISWDWSIKRISYDLASGLGGFISQMEVFTKVNPNPTAPCGSV
jgi:hypothetical protein